jgi:hypothetical protein
MTGALGPVHCKLKGIHAISLADPPAKVGTGATAV